MAKRFGRNQRRKLREDVASLNRQNDELHRWRASESLRAANLSRRLETWARDVVRLMGADSAFNERVRVMTVEDTFGDQLQLAPIDMLPAPTFRGPIPAATVQTIITALIWRFHLSRDEFTNRIRIELVNRYAEPVGYALPAGHVWTERDADYLSRRIAEQMIAHMGRTKND